MASSHPFRRGPLFFPDFSHPFPPLPSSSRLFLSPFLIEMLLACVCLCAYPNPINVFNRAILTPRKRQLWNLLLLTRLFPTPLSPTPLFPTHLFPNLLPTIRPLLLLSFLLRKTSTRFWRAMTLRSPTPTLAVTPRSTSSTMSCRDWRLRLSRYRAQRALDEDLSSYTLLRIIIKEKNNLKPHQILPKNRYFGGKYPRMF